MVTGVFSNCLTIHGGFIFRRDLVLPEQRQRRGPPFRRNLLHPFRWRVR